MINLSSTTEVAVTQDSLFIHGGLLATIPTLNTAGSRLNIMIMKHTKPKKVRSHFQLTCT